ncbi:hypothetical protein B0H67DRAFT_26927 [Lasiosphaeris hirsuta]|uniref:Uncharacterized protein n=1 Tax=Lasiosphaeris hirsuta TaxID=260670 RepID=A0AA40B9S3_9PEZI|nr:hypothetical protein B0H67DRAFT_26927 [Lasiosphaeris hirsuta]
MDAIGARECYRCAVTVAHTAPARPSSLQAGLEPPLAPSHRHPSLVGQWVPEQTAASARASMLGLRAGMLSKVAHDPGGLHRGHTARLRARSPEKGNYGRPGLGTSRP